MHEKNKDMRYLLTFISAMLLMVSCSSNDDNQPVTEKAKRTVFIYMAGENNLSNFTSDDLQEMISGVGSIPANSRMLVFADKADSKTKPFIAQITSNKQQPLDTLYKYTNDFYTSDADCFREVMERMMSLSPSDEYALILWGHASGWAVEKDTIVGPSRRAYGVDNGTNTNSNNGKWMNITQMARALEGLTPFKFIFADCCNMGCAEVGYELRNTTEYFIASPAEIPGNGAPYDKIMSSLFKSGSDMYRGIVDGYFNYYTDFYHQKSPVSVSGVGYENLDGFSVPLSVIDTRYIAQLAERTRDVLTTIAPQYPNEPDLKGIPYYWQFDAPVMYDMKAYIQRYASAADYTSWKQAFDLAVPYSRMSFKWMTIYYELYYTGFSQFDQTADCGCVSMFIPQNGTGYTSGSYAYNKYANNFCWNRVLNWSRFGW